jgi:hypothetical protein
MPMNKLSPVGTALFGNCRACLIHSALAQLSASRPRTRLQQQRQENVGSRLDLQHRRAVGRHFDHHPFRGLLPAGDWVIAGTGHSSLQGGGGAGGLGGRGGGGFGLVAMRFSPVASTLPRRSQAATGTMNCPGCASAVT